MFKLYPDIFDFNYLQFFLVIAREDYINISIKNVISRVKSINLLNQLNIMKYEESWEF